MRELAAARLALIGLALLTALVYREAYSAGFVYEDGPWLVPIAWSSLWSPRWLTSLTWYADTWLTLGDPRGFHVLNVGWHVLNGVLLYVVLRRWLVVSAAVLAVTVFLLHPIQIESVAYVASRAELVSTCAVLLALLAAVDRPRGWQLVGIGAACVAAMAAKEAAIGVVGILVCRYLLMASSRSAVLLTLAGGLIPLAIWRAAAVLSTVTTDPAVQHGPLGHAAMQSAALLRLLALVVWPDGLTVDHDWDLVPRALAVVALGVVAIGGPLLVWTLRRRWPLGACSVALVLCAMVPRMVVPAYGEYLTEHHLYLPMIGLSVLVAGAVRWIAWAGAAAWAWSNWHPVPQRPLYG